MHSVSKFVVYNISVKLLYSLQTEPQILLSRILNFQNIVTIGIWSDILLENEGSETKGQIDIHVRWATVRDT